MTTFEFSEGNLFDEELDVLLNPVNCKGVSGAGLAKEFAKRFPLAQNEYERVSKLYAHVPDLTGRVRKTKVFRPGDLLQQTDEDTLNNEIKTVVFFPTKNHYKNPSKMEYINSGTKTLVKLLSKDAFKGNRVGIPALGCGLGGLDRVEVSYLLYEGLKELDNEITVVFFAPLLPVWI